MSLRKKNYVQPGDLVDLRWNARLSEQLGVFNFETGKSTVGKIIEDNFRLSILSSFCSLIDALLPEREKCKNFFQMCDQFINNLTAEKYSSQDIVKKYLTWEIALLAEIGISLNLKACVLTGSSRNLKYVSPKSGCAVSEEYAGDYLKNLIRLPHFLGGKSLLNGNINDDLLGGFNLTYYFFKKFFHSIDYNYIDKPLLARADLMKNFKLKFVS